jgi:hypothetical protein
MASSDMWHGLKLFVDFSAFLCFLTLRQVYDGTQDDDPHSHTFSQSAAVKSYYGSSYFGTVLSPGVTTMRVDVLLSRFAPRSLTLPPPSGCLQSRSLTAAMPGTVTTGSLSPLPCPVPRSRSRV